MDPEGFHEPHSLSALCVRLCSLPSYTVLLHMTVTMGRSSRRLAVALNAAIFFVLSTVLCSLARCIANYLALLCAL